MAKTEPTTDAVLSEQSPPPKDIRLTQRFARHKSILTTAVYSHPTDEDLLRAVTGLPC
jgi:hypothetical protein